MGGLVLSLINKQLIFASSINCLPTIQGEKIVCRILNTRPQHFSLDQIGMQKEQLAAYQHSMLQTQGIILVTGPTGSGKTLTLYAALNALNTGDKNIMTAEDPVEIELPGINQVQIKPNIGLDFNQTLRTFLRQDPDIIMVGEIRDVETATTAIQAAQTGHLVLSTLHTNSAEATLMRLKQMGIPAYHLTASLQLIIAQRLLRRLCERCKIPLLLKEAQRKPVGLEKNDGHTLYQAKGCEHCHHGYLGRIAVFQVLPMSDGLQTLLLQEAPLYQYQDFCRAEGVISLRQAGLAQVCNGVTSLMELDRVLGDPL